MTKEHITPQMIRDTAAWCQSEDELRDVLRQAADALTVALSAVPEAVVRWLPIEHADKTIVDVQTFAQVGITLRNSERFWVRDADGRTYEASWSESDRGMSYWWDWDGESPVDPVEFMPHPLDPRWASIATTEGSTDG